MGVIRILIKPEWIESLAGQNTLTGNLAGVVFGVFMYFPTLVEVPIAQMFLSLGMHRGPLLAYLMADPGTQPAEHPDHLHHHREAQSLGVCRLGGILQHPGRAHLWRVGGWHKYWLIDTVSRSFPG